MKKLVLAAVALVAAGVWIASAPSASSSRGRRAPVDSPGARFFADGGQFVVECTVARTAHDDPIVHPGEPGASHLHEFFGSEAVDASSTGVSLQGTATSCDNAADAASYWAPALSRDGTRVEPVGFTAYYRVAPGVDPADVAPFPAGLAMIAGDGRGTAVAGWGCGRGSTLAATPPACPPSAPLEVRVTFPDCWDGGQLDSTDHRSHMAYSGPDGCEGSHDVAVPRLTVVLHYGIAGDPSGLALSSGDVMTAHADFLNGWDPDALARQVSVCLHRDVVCGIPDSSRTGGSEPTESAARYPQFGGQMPKRALARASTAPVSSTLAAAPRP